MRAVITSFFIKEGFNGYIAKPVSGALLEAAVLNILPKELVMLSEGAMQTEIGKDVLMFDQRKRVPLLVTTDSVCDLPAELFEETGNCGMPLLCLY